MLLVAVSFSLFNSFKDFIAFSQRTPGGNVFTGYLCRKRNKSYGSLNVVSVNGEPCNYWVQSMPKLNYLDKANHYCRCTFNPKDYNFYEKLDGSCIIFFPLYNEKRKVIEVCMKTRKTPILTDKKFLKLLKKHESEINQIKKICKKNLTVMCELVGTANKHHIKYDFDSKLVLINAYDNVIKEFVPGRLRYISMMYGIEQPKKINLGKSLDEIIIKLNNINKDGTTIEGLIATYKKNKTQYKIKPDNIRIKHISENGVPLFYIKNELQKIENLKEWYEKDFHGLKEEIEESLLEDFSALAVFNEKTQKRIIQSMDKKYKGKPINENIKEIIDEIYDPSLNIKDNMRKFAKEYPQLKKKSADAFNYLNEKVKKNE